MGIVVKGHDLCLRYSLAMQSVSLVLPLKIIMEGMVPLDKALGCVIHYFGRVGGLMRGLDGVNNQGEISMVHCRSLFFISLHLGELVMQEYVSVNMMPSSLHQWRVLN